ncbi:MAG: hypothetical protein ACRDN0_40065 [Trebonia sp.]
MTDFLHLAGEGIRLTIDRRTGAIARLESAETGWRVQDRPELGAGFRLLIPLPGRRDNLARGEQQDPPRLQRASDSEIVLSWPRVRSARGGEHQIGVTQRITVTGRRLLFETTVDNQSDRVVENVWAPCLGDLRPPAPHEELSNFCYSYGSAARLRMWPRFENICGYWGVDHPTQMGSRDAISTGVTPVSPFMLVLAREQGLYAGVAQRRDDLVSWHSELVPGYEDSISGRPDPDATIRFSTVHLPFIAPAASARGWRTASSTMSNGSRATDASTCRLARRPSSCQRTPCLRVPYRPVDRTPARPGRFTLAIGRRRRHT